MTYDPGRKAQVFGYLQRGYTVPQASKASGIPQPTIYRWIKLREEGALDYLNKKASDALPNPKIYSDLSPEAQKALEDFDYWRYRYMGRRSQPWQAEAAHNTVEWLQNDQTELVVVNVAPGAGKSTLFTCDIPLWLICRDRTIREFLGHRVISEAQKYSRRMRKALSRTRPLPPDPSQGRNDFADGCLAVDYGRFQPKNTEVWRADEFTVLAEFDGEESMIEDKEATVTAKGMGTEFLGMRSEFVCWDDLVTNAILASSEQMEKQQQWWDSEAVTRVEPGGCLLLVGQRKGPEDLYRYCLDERIPPTEHFAADIEHMSAEDYSEWLNENGRSRYRHIIFPAHFEDRCTNDHGNPTDYTDSKYAYPNGCLLDPVRLPWEMGANSLRVIRANRESKYLIEYQQEDVDPETVLVPKIAIEGGTDKDGNVYPGCLDRFRGLCELPKGLAAPVVSVLTADPSPTQYWGIEWWIYHPASEQRFLMDLHRARMGANEFLDWNENSREFYGLAHDWWERSRDLGHPITHVIFEKNAAQMFVLQYNHVSRWIRKTGVQIIGFNTTIRKNNEDAGIPILRDKYLRGNVRLPYKINDKAYYSSPAKVASDHLIREATSYPQSATTDCLMAHYFLEANIENLARQLAPKPRSRAPRPSWMKQKVLTNA